jgi:hypothetical protein
MQSFERSPIRVQRPDGSLRGGLTVILFLLGSGHQPGPDPALL